jgi:hypothetical protein
MDTRRKSRKSQKEVDEKEIAYDTSGRLAV